MNVIFLTTPQSIADNFQRLLPTFEKLPPIEEFAPKDLERMATDGRLYIGYAEKDGDIVMVAAFEFVRYASMMSVNIVAMSGQGIDEIYQAYFDKFKQFCSEAGADAIDALCSDAMMRLLSRYGFKKTYNHVRINL